MLIPIHNVLLDVISSKVFICVGKLILMRLKVIKFVLCLTMFLISGIMLYSVAINPSIIPLPKDSMFFTAFLSLIMGTVIASAKIE